MQQKKTTEEMWKKAFPEFAVKQTLNEFKLQRGDEIVVSQIQTQLLPRCIYDILKSSCIHAFLQKRKFLKEDDFVYAKNKTIFPLHNPPAEATGPILDQKNTFHLCEEMLQLVNKYIEKWGQESDPEFECKIKLSQSQIVILHNLLESCIRGFLYRLSKQSKSCIINNKHFDATMSLIMGDWSMSLNDDIFNPF